jgi:hypothetical protein
MAFPFTCALYASSARNPTGRGMVETDMDAGPPKRRRRSLEKYQIVASYAVTSAELTSFNNWYRTDAGSGVNSFEWTDPRNSTVRIVRFSKSSPYAISQISPARWRIDVQLEEWS